MAPMSQRPTGSLSPLPRLVAISLSLSACGDSSTPLPAGTPRDGAALDTGTSQDGTVPGADGQVGDGPAEGANPAPDANGPNGLDDAFAEGATDGSGGDAPGADAPSGLDSSRDGPSGGCATLPTGGLYVTLVDSARQTVSHLWVDNQTGINQLLAYWRSMSLGGLPVGTLVCMPAAWNCPWHFYIDPQDIQFSEVGIEACQGWDLEVEMNCNAFRAGAPNGCYSPLGETITEVRDCRADPTCPIVPR
jgi:hypothetical protein